MKKADRLRVEKIAQLHPSNVYDCLTPTFTKDPEVGVDVDAYFSFGRPHM